MMGWPVVLLAVLATALAGCGDDTTPNMPDTRPSETPRTSATAPPAPPPKAGACYRLSYRAATRPSSEAAPVPCRQEHTAVTVFVGAVDPEKVTARVSTVCPRKVADHIGGDPESRRLSRFQAIWFVPTPSQAERGARWYRCDVVVLAGNDRLMSLPRDTRGILDDEGVLERFGTCGTTAPGRQGFTRVACARPHSWRAVSTIDLPRGARYLAGPVTQQADAQCRDLAAEASDSALRFSWSFEWPSREAWRNGQRWGWCWLPV